MRLLLLIFMVLSSLLQGEMSDHFRKIQCLDRAPHKFHNIDFVYMINLDSRPEKFQKSLEQLLPYSLYPYRFPAINGWELSLETINDVGVKYNPQMAGGFLATFYSSKNPSHELIQRSERTYFFYHPGACAHLPLGAIGCYLSHLSLLQDAYDAGYQTIWVMEDDIEVIKDPRIIPTLIEKLDRKVGREHWDILFTDKDFRSSKGEYIPCVAFEKRPNYTPHDPEKSKVRKKIDQDFQKIGARFGLHSMIVTRRGMEKILNFAKDYKIFLPIDMDIYLIDDLNCYTVLDDVVGNLPVAASDTRIQNFTKSKNS